MLLAVCCRCGWDRTVCFLAAALPLRKHFLWFFVQDHCGVFFFLIFIKAFLKLQGRRRVEPSDGLDLVLGPLLIRQ